MKMLNELWNGNIVPCEKSFFDDPDYRKTANSLYDIDERLRKTLNPEQAELLTSMQDVGCEQSAIAERDMFFYAFCLGARMILDVMEGTA